MSRGWKVGLGTAPRSAWAAGAASAALDRYPPGGPDRWSRTNHRGEPISLLEGQACVAVSAQPRRLAPQVPGRIRSAALVAGTAAGALGAYDDLAEGSVRKGLA